MSVLKQVQVSPETVLAKAVLSASNQMGLSQSELAMVLGLHRTGISRLKKKQALDPQSKQGELALSLIRIARALFALTGGDNEWMKHFMRSHNKLTGGIPIEQIQTINGLFTVLHFVDAIRGKV